MRRLAQLGWVAVAAALLVALAGGVLMLAGAAQAGRVLCLVGVACGLLGALAGVLAEKRVATLRLAGKGLSGHLTVADCVQDILYGEPTVQLVGELHLPGRAPIPIRLRGRLPEPDIHWLVAADEVPCIADPAQPHRVWLVLPDEHDRRGRLVQVQGEEPAPGHDRRGLPPSA